MQFAVQGGHEEVVKTLLTKGANFLARNTHDTVLHQAVISINIEVTKLILSKIKDKFRENSQLLYQYLDAKDNERDTPLMWAITSKINTVDKVSLVLEYGANVNVLNSDGMTPLHLATKLDNLAVVKLLVNKEANVNAINNDGKTPWDLATGEQYMEICACLKS